jgi:alpha-L-fucosidase
MGEWLDVNGEAIYGTTASPFRYLPFFGRATVKGDVLYVHVFYWPSNRRIVLPGLMNQVRSAKPLAAQVNTGENPDSLSVSRDETGVVVQLPAEAPNAVAGVIALQLDGSPRVAAYTISPQADGRIILPATFAEIRARHGQRARFDAVGDEVYVTNWTAAKDCVCWQFQVAKPGRYEVIVNYGADPASAGGTYEVATGPITATQKTGQQIDDTSIGRIFELPANAAILKSKIESTGGPTKFTDHTAGTIELPAGTNLLQIRPAQLPPKDTLMNLRQVTLKPANE